MPITERDVDYPTWLCPPDLKENPVTATPAYVLSCEGKPAGLPEPNACGNQMRGPAGCTVEETRRIATTAYGWLTKYGDLCPECAAEQVETVYRG